MTVKSSGDAPRGGLEICTEISLTRGRDNHLKIKQNTICTLPNTNKLQPCQGNSQDIRSTQVMRPNLASVTATPPKFLFLILQTFILPSTFSWKISRLTSPCREASQTAMSATYIWGDVQSLMISRTTTCVHTHFITLVSVVYCVLRINVTLLSLAICRIGLFHDTYFHHFNRFTFCLLL